MTTNTTESNSGVQTRFECPVFVVCASDKSAESDADLGTSTIKLLFSLEEATASVNGEPAARAQ